MVAQDLIARKLTPEKTRAFARNSLDVIDLNSLLLDLYHERCHTQDGWYACLDQFRVQFSASQAVCISRSQATGAPSELLVCSDEPHPEARRAFFDRFSAIDPFSNLPPDRVCSVDDIMTERQWIKSDFYRNYLQPQNVMQVLGADIPISNDTVFALRICRPHNSSAFGKRDRDALQFLIPHIRRVAETRLKQLHTLATEQVFGSLMDNIGLGVVILDQNGAIMQMNGGAEQLISERDGVLVTHNSLRASNSHDNEQLQELIRLALRSNGESGQVVGALGVRRLDGREPLGVAVRNLPQANAATFGAQRATVSVLFRDASSRTNISEAAMQNVFGLTRSETRLAVALVRGLTIDEAAQALGVSRNTVRTHLNGLFSKTNTNRQSEVIRILLGSIAALC